jgi:hypothetical protein
MFDVIGKKLFAALRDAAEQRLGRDHPCFAALAEAVSQAGFATTEAAQIAIATLDPTVAAALMADAHKALRDNPHTILDAWTGGGKAH